MEDKNEFESYEAMGVSEFTCWIAFILALVLGIVWCLVRLGGAA